MTFPTEADFSAWAVEAKQRREDLRAAGASDDEADAIVDYAHVQLETTSAAESLRIYRQEQAERHAAAIRSYRQRLLDAGAPELHLRHTFDVEPETDIALEAARKFIRNDALFLLLVGNKGTHKTGAAVRAMSDYCMPSDKELLYFKRAIPAAFITADKIAKLGGFDKAKEMEALERCAFLVVDDLGAEYGDSKGWFSSLFTALVNARYGAALKTVITSNLTWKDEPKTGRPGIVTIYGERIEDRIRESGTIVNIGGPSLRKPRSPKPLPARGSKWIEPMPAVDKTREVKL